MWSVCFAEIGQTKEISVLKVMRGGHSILTKSGQTKEMSVFLISRGGQFVLQRVDRLKRQVYFQ